MRRQSCSDFAGSNGKRGRLVKRSPNHIVHVVLCGFLLDRIAMRRGCTFPLRCTAVEIGWKHRLMVGTAAYHSGNLHAEFEHLANRALGEG